MKCQLKLNHILDFMKLRLKAVVANGTVYYVILEALPCSVECCN